MKLWIWISVMVVISGHAVYAQQQVKSLCAPQQEFVRTAVQLQKNACLLVAIFKGNVKSIKELIENGADVNVHDEKNHAPAWIIAVFDGNKKNKMFTAHNVLSIAPYIEDIDIPNDMGMTAFMYAAECDNPDVMKLLKKHGAATNSKDRMGFTALWYAVHACSLQALHYLLTLDDIDLTITDGGGKTVLQYAARRNLAKVVELLLQRTDVRLSDKNAALREASERGYLDIGLMLLRAGAVPSPKELVELSFSNKNSVSHISFEIIDDSSLRGTPSTDSTHSTKGSEDGHTMTSDSEHSHAMDFTPTLHDDIFESIACDSITLDIDTPQVPVA